jgi:chromosome segregation ATPase
VKNIIMLIASALLAVTLNACASTGIPAAEIAPKPEIKAAPSSERIDRLKEIIEASKTRTLSLDEWKEIGELSGWNELSDSAEKMIQTQKTPPKKSDLVTELLKTKEHELQLQTSLDIVNEELKAKADEGEMLIKKVDELSKGQTSASALEDIAKTREENRNLQRENEALKERVKALEEATSNVADSQKLKGQITELKSRIERLKLEQVAPEKYQAALDDAQRLHSENSSLQAENAGLKQALSEAKTRGDEAYKFVEQLTARFDALSRKYEQLNEYLSRRK